MSREAYERFMRADFQREQLQVAPPEGEEGSEGFEPIDWDELTEEQRAALATKIAEGMLSWGDPNIAYLAKSDTSERDR